MTWKTFIRPVLVLLVIGVIIGLGAIYINIDESDVNAESNEEIEGQLDEENMDKPTTPPENGESSGDMTKPDEDTHPVPLEDIGMSGELKIVLDMAKGYVVVTGDADSTHMRYIESGEVQHEASVTHPYVTADVGKYGLALIVRVDNGISVYTFDESLVEKSCRRVEGATGQASILLQDDLSVLYERVNGISSVIYSGDNATTNSILDIDNPSRIKAMYNTGYGDTYVVYESGLVVNTLPTIWRTRLSLGYEIADIRPIMYEDKISYAVLDKGDIDRHIMIYTGDFRLRHSESTLGDNILYTDTLYTIDREEGMLDKFCACGRLDERVETDIDHVTFVDYVKRMMYYVTRDGSSYICQFGTLRNRALLDAVVLYDNAEFCIYFDDIMRLRFK